MTKITIEQYVDFRKTELDNLEAFWLKGEKTEGYPEFLEEEDWHEQELAFIAQYYER